MGVGPDGTECGGDIDVDACDKGEDVVGIDPVVWKGSYDCWVGEGVGIGGLAEAEVEDLGLEHLCLEKCLAGRGQLEVGVQVGSRPGSQMPGGGGV